MIDSSSAWAVTGFLVKILIEWLFSSSFKKFLTILSSSEWNDITANLPPPDSALTALGKKSFRFSNSLFTSILRAWNVLVAGWILPNWNFLALEPTTSFTLVVHDLSFERNPFWYGPKQRLWHRALRPRALVARAHRIIAVSEWTKHDLCTRYGVAPEKITVLYPTPSAVTGNELFPLPPAIAGNRFILFFAAIEVRKNPLSLVEAFEHIAAKHADLHLVIAGKFGYGAEHVFAAAARSRFRDRIHVLGYVSAEMRRSLYATATVFAYPSFYEGFGIPLLDAMRAGLPIVTSNRSAMPEVIGDAGILIDPGAVGELALALDALLSDATFARALAARARERAVRFPEQMQVTERIFF